MRILLVEDDQDFADALLAQLRLRSIEAVAAPQSWKAIADLLDQPLDVLITDVLMPEFDGLEVIREARKHHPKLPIIAISGGGTKVSANMALTLSKGGGASRVLFKPFTLGELLTAIGDLVPSFRSPDVA